MLARLDVGAPSGTRRFEVIDELHAAGVHVELNVLPWIPGVSDTANLIARLPNDMPITFGPLSMGQWSDTRRLLGREHRRDDVWAAYLEEYSLCSVDERAIEEVDPGAPTARARLRLVAELVANDIPVAVSAAPWIPGLTDAGELIARVPPRVPIRFAPLNVVSPLVAASPWGARYDQAQIDAAYLAARAEIGDRPHVYWALPVGRPGGSARQMHNLDGTTALGGDTFGLRFRRRKAGPP